MRAELGWRIIRFLITAAAMFGMWLLFTTSLEPFSLIAGAVGSVLVAALTYDVFIARHQANIRFFIPNPVFLLLYFFMLVFFLYQASFRMMKAVITGISSPKIVYFRTRIRSDLGRMILANSITLTPGTITLDLNDDHLIVHWFFCTTSHAKAAGEEVKGRMEKLLKKVWL